MKKTFNEYLFLAWFLIYISFENLVKKESLKGAVNCNFFEVLEIYWRVNSQSLISYRYGTRDILGMF